MAKLFSASQLLRDLRGFDDPFSAAKGWMYGGIGYRDDLPRAWSAATPSSTWRNTPKHTRSSAFDRKPVYPDPDPDPDPDPCPLGPCWEGPACFG